MTLKDLVLPSYAQMLEALSGQLAKARTQSEQAGKVADTLLEARLAQDMFPLSVQVQFACLQAEEARARLLNETADAPEAPGSFAEAEELIARTVVRLRTGGDGPEADEERAVELSLPNGMTFDFDLTEYVRSWSLPQFYFHLMTAYAILRNQGIEIGKADYVPHMMRFLRM